jgi:hypothetical protein
MDTSRRDMLLASLLATLPAMVVSEAVARSTLHKPSSSPRQITTGFRTRTTRSAAWICVRWQAHLPSRGYM